MFGLDLKIWLIILLVGIAAGCLAYAFLFSNIETETRVANRIKRVKAAETDWDTVAVTRQKLNEAAKRRKSIQESLKTLEEKQKKNASQKSPSLKMQIQQAGWKIGVSHFHIVSVATGLAAGAMMFVMTGRPLLALGLVFAAGLGLPRWILSFARKRRMKAFLDEFPNALDVMVRAIKSGLPLNDSLHLIAAEAQEPLRTEFRRIVEAQQFGMSVPEACVRLNANIPLPETSFFGIVVTIQAQAGGNLSEALGNLSRVLRDRKKMKAKVNALSMEAKASAAIIGSLPFIIVLLVYLTTPDYIITLFTEPRGNIILGASLVWMTIGIFVMRNMTNFEI
ncbi:type II secretion system F family protein [Hoeflea sp. CAU 1731]